MRHHVPGTSRETGLSTPRAAGFAGVAFAVLLGAAIVLVRTGLPSGAGGEDISIDEDGRASVNAAVHMVPFAGIAFLWFMGALREHTGEAEDRFFATVFLGSGLVFVAALFGATAAAGTVLAAGQPEAFGRHFAYTLLTTYAMRMAAVFVFATSAIGRRLGVLPRPLSAFGFLVGLALLVVGASVPWSELVFPVWALVISLYVLRTTRGGGRPARHSDGPV
ncbi:hypothetical protein ACFV7Q_30395 [Streptomyces sp. NPDC059851]|uniref:hypothetical protein n=1 Tax=Streptomyces sp. NPDC059851 TaxID=3346971 RepID=UPI0036527E8F